MLQCGLMAVPQSTAITSFCTRTSPVSVSTSTSAKFAPKQLRILPWIRGFGVALALHYLAAQIWAGKSDWPKAWQAIAKYGRIYD